MLGMCKSLGMGCERVNVGVWECVNVGCSNLMVKCPPGRKIVETFPSAPAVVLPMMVFKDFF
jgi:hypothetical protein